VSVTGPKNDSDVTDENGCASFLYRPAGSYTVAISKAGYVTPALVTNISKVETVPSGSVATDSFDYDVAGQVTANAVTYQQGTGTLVADDTASLAVSQPGLPAPGIKVFTASPAKTPIATGFVLYPFSSTYGVYSGTCTAANPLSFPPDAPANAQVNPGGSVTVNVVEPSLNVVVKDGAGVGIAGATVKATNKTCGTGGNLTYTNATLATGRLPKPGMPYGTYDLCASATISGTLRHSAVTAGVQNKAKAGTADVPLAITTTSVTGACP
jgi:hypothetical protein